VNVTFHRVSGRESASKDHMILGMIPYTSATQQPAGQSWITAAADQRPLAEIDDGVQVFIVRRTGDFVATNINFSRKAGL